MVDAPFSIIEQKIMELAGIVKTLKEEKAALTAQLGRKDAETKDLANRVSDLTRERDAIRERVEAVLARLESLEL
jgi:FtsZ-binding cell division protein ZapB